MVELPKGVHRVVARGKVYFYWQPGRGTASVGLRVRLPNDPKTPEFWTALRAIQEIDTAPGIKTFGDVLDEYLASPKFRGLSPGTQEQYKIQIRTARAGFGAKAADDMRPALVRAVVEGMADRPGAANSFLGVMRAISSWGIARDYFKASIAAGVEPYAKTGGHKPWTEAQLAAGERLTGMVRRGFLLLRYTGQRGSDVVRLGETFIDDGGFRLTQKKTNREVWCPIEDRLAAEIATWGRRPGPYLVHPRGPYTRKVLDKHFADQRAEIPELAGVTLHGLRGTRVVELRRDGLTTAQIQDQVGMSLAMIERYCRFADKKASGKASVVTLRELKARRK